MALPLTIPTKPPEHPAMDYEFLRREGLRHLERLGGQLWTDFNAHDPGITILEQVCYALTDLAYRIDYDVKDLLTREGEDAYRSLHSPAQVLTIHPVTLTDLRKLAIDVPSVKNAWFEPVEEPRPGLLYDPSEEILHLKTDSPEPSHYEPVPLLGVYRVLLETDNNQAYDAPAIQAEVNRRLQACRALCQDFLYPTILPGQGIVVQADIEVGRVDDPERLLAEIYCALAAFISPSIHFYTLSEMFDRGLSIDEIMDGPALQHGFIIDAELEKLERKEGLRASDLIRVIMNVTGVSAVRSLSISDGAHSDAWYLKLDPLRQPFLDLVKSFPGAASSTIRLVRGNIQAQTDPGRVSELVKRMLDSSRQQPLPAFQRDILLPAGRDRKIGQYHSIQHQFPATYGVGSMGLPDSASRRRKGQAKQLKAYLMFFDQLLANYFAQLANAKELFSFYAPQPRTYFSQVVEDASLGLDEIRVNDLETHAANVQQMTEASALATEIVGSNDPAAAGRKNRFLNHLLARFAEQFTDYSLLLYVRLGQQDLLDDKSAFLRDYDEIGRSRGCGFNYSLPSYGTENVSGLEKRICLKLGISSYQKRGLAALDPQDEGGFHLLEHVLLRPSLADEQQWKQAAAGTGWQASAFMKQPASRDPYSRQVSYIFPTWVTRFAEAGFMDLIANTVREETPAHLQVHVHWLDRDPMLAFEAAYKAWLESMIAAQWWDLRDLKPGDEEMHRTHIRLREARDRIVRILGLGTPYPLRDLPLDYPPTIAYDHPAQIQIVGGQTGVLYQLCDEDGNPFVEKERRFEVRAEPGMADTGIVLTTPAIQNDITFTVLAIREAGEAGSELETYLNQPVSIKAGIDTTLPVSFHPSEAQVASGTQIIVNYGDEVAVTIDRTQVGISYRLVSGSGKEVDYLSEPVEGDQGSLTFSSTKKFEEDTEVSIQAFRTTEPSVSARLDIGLSVRVRPDPVVGVSVETQIVAYDTSTAVHLSGAQDSVKYELYMRELVRADYLLRVTEDSLVVKTDEGRDVSIAVPEKIDDWEALGGFIPVGMFQGSGGSPSTSTGNLLEDTIFIVRATKTWKQGEQEQKEELQLYQRIPVLVRPDTKPTVKAEPGSVAKGKEGMVTVGNTQKGVEYRLVLDNKPIEPPGYHYTDRGIETIRLEVDLKVEEQGDDVLKLPTGPITKQTTFNVLATKTLTGVSAQLTGMAKISAK